MTALFKILALVLGILDRALGRAERNEAKQAGRDELELEMHRDADARERDVADAIERVRHDEGSAYADPRNRRRRNPVP